MNNRVTRIFTIGMALAAAAAVHAQDKTVTANVPFGFSMGSTAMPAGAYKVSEIRGGIVALKTSGAIKAATTHSVSGKKTVEPARLVFHRYGDAYFLAEVWDGDGNTGLALAKTSREKELAMGSVPTLAVIRLAIR